ncbi:phytoene desaturase family protein [Flavilitoribacter nigricans]|uniref:Phytoene dehydrogenase n=1 Tax=Flavilitoribacter nigricans (strain ATCC 23147 / DSM 23189 / NBRC 102662 / NCIMB 1420 / SS-2) TaxID=1122177 RepID=A0A2D0MYN0_FLAN2|nr:phytoene desaturase family protein [Flavilitoribacter nigricans]PHN00989.1 phytoene dehydrogenase [Flavilitoribacter nigricans DSM 23189 = NBRC 102662]
MGKKVIVIGSGFAGLAAATTLADQGYEVRILEKNEVPGGRARQFEAEGFTFDMGPSWYWMPDVFDTYFQRFGKQVSDYYDLVRLDPSYQIYFGPEDIMEVPAQLNDLKALFERYEPGSGKHLDKFLEEAAYKYRVGMQEFVQKPGHSILEFADMRVLKSVFRLQMFQSMSSHVRSLFRHEQLRQMLEFPVLFLGATPENTPAMYSLMNYADLVLGTWYPMGGMHKIVEGMVALAREKGVQLRTGEAVQRIDVVNGVARKVITDRDQYTADIVVGAADYHHVEQQLLDPEWRQYTESYWDKRTMAPSSLLYYVGVNKRLRGLHHHNLFFDEDFSRHAVEIYDQPQWPSKPLFYVCAPSVTDPSVAPEGHENLFILIPTAPDLQDTDSEREKYYDIVMDRLEKLTGQDVRGSVVYKRSYAHRDFKADYHAYKGNAYGLANTLRQTAFLKPKLRSKKVKNLFYAGQLTTPGPGVPPSLISGQVVAAEIAKNHKLNKPLTSAV